MRIRLLALGIIVSMMFAQTTSASPIIPVYLDGTRVSFHVDPIVDNGSTLVEFAGIFEKLGLDIDYDVLTQTVTGKNDGLDVRLRIGSNIAILNGQLKELAVAPRMEKGYILVPLRFVGEASGKTINWDSKIGVISIFSSEKDRVPLVTSDI